MNTNEHKNSVLTKQIDKDVRKKFDEWKNILVGEDIHSIRNQIWEMIRDCAFFQCLNESRKYTLKDDKGEIKQNKMLHYFINQSFFKTQLLSIRRLVDKDFGRIQKNKKYTVYSLFNLVEDLKRHSDLLTRENVLASCDLSYDFEKALAEYKKSIDCTKPYYVPHRIASSEDIHRRIDSIAGIVADKRSPNDMIPLDVLHQFEDRLSDIEELCKYVDKYIAHPTTPESRTGISNEIEGALGKVLNAHKVICETARFIGNKLLFCGFGEVLSISQYGRFSQFDRFEYLDEPIANKNTIKKLKELWERYRIETSRWNIF